MITGRDPIPSQVSAFLEKLIRELPKSPNNKETVDQLRSMNTHSLLTIYMSWKVRLIEPKPRIVNIWQPGVSPESLFSQGPGVSFFLKKVKNGEDINEHLSTLVKRIGYRFRNKSEPINNEVDINDKDEILIRTGLYHFHIGSHSTENKKMRSNNLIFAHVTEKLFTIVSIYNHDVFDKESDAHNAFREASKKYIERKMKPGTLYIHHPVTVSGHSDYISDHALYCSQRLKFDGSKLDNNEFISQFLKNPDIANIKKPKFEWALRGIDLCVLEKKSGVYVPMVEYRDPDF